MKQTSNGPTPIDTRVIEMFNAKVDRLDRTRLATRMAKANYRLDSERIVNGDWIAINGITEDDVDAFVLNLRCLLQDGDGFSVNCLSKVYAMNGVPDEYRREFEVQRECLQTHWERPSMIHRLEGKGTYTNNELFAIIVYGGLAHCDRKYDQEFLRLTRLDLLSAIVFAVFEYTLQVLLTTFKKMRDINRNLLSTRPTVSPSDSPPVATPFLTRPTAAGQDK